MKKTSLFAVAIMLGACSQSQESKTSDRATAVAPGAAASSVVTVTTSSPEALAEFNKGMAAWDNADEPGVAEHLQKAIDLDPDFAQAHAYLGVATPGAEGQAELERAVSKAAALPEAERLLIQARMLQKRGDFGRALDLGKKVATLAPEDVRVLLFIGKVAIDGLRRFDEAEAALKRAAELSPTRGSVFNYLGYLYASQKKWDQAIAAFKRYAELAPNEPNPHDSLAEGYLNANRLEEAKASFAKATEVQPSFFPAWMGLAQARALTGDFKGAADAIAKGRDAAKLPRENVDGFVNLYVTQAAEGLMADALKTLALGEKAAEEANLPVYAFMALDKAFLLADSGNGVEAMRESVEGLARADRLQLPGDAAASARLLGLSMRAYGEIVEKKDVEAVKTIAALEEETRQATAGPWTTSSFHWIKGELALSHGDARGAISELKQCIEIDGYCQLRLMKAMEKAGDVAGARVLEQKIIDNPLRDPWYLFARAKLGSIPKPTTAQATAKEPTQPAGKHK
jgi:Flp pilus assembly protein TadD